MKTNKLRRIGNESQRDILITIKNTNNAIKRIKPLNLSKIEYKNKDEKSLNYDK